MCQQDYKLSKAPLPYKLEKAPLRRSSDVLGLLKA